jgi:hypothetical protein
MCNSKYVFIMFTLACSMGMSSFADALPLCEYRGMQFFDTPGIASDEYQYYCHMVGYGTVSEKVGCDGYYRTNTSNTDYDDIFKPKEVAFKDKMRVVADRLNTWAAEGKCKLVAADCKLGLFQYESSEFPAYPCFPSHPERTEWKNISYIKINDSKTYSALRPEEVRICIPKVYTQKDTRAGEVINFIDIWDGGTLPKALKVVKDGADVLVRSGVCSAPTYSTCNFTLTAKSVGQRSVVLTSISSTAIEGEWITPRRYYSDSEPSFSEIHDKIFMNSGVCTSTSWK